MRAPYIGDFYVDSIAVFCFTIVMSNAHFLKSSPISQAGWSAGWSSRCWPCWRCVSLTVSGASWQSVSRCWCWPGAWPPLLIAALTSCSLSWPPCTGPWPAWPPPQPPASPASWSSPLNTSSSLRAMEPHLSRPSLFSSSPSFQQKFQVR